MSKAEEVFYRFEKEAGIGSVMKGLGKATKELPKNIGRINRNIYRHLKETGKLGKGTDIASVAKTPLREGRRANIIGKSTKGAIEGIGLPAAFGLGGYGAYKVAT